MSSKPIKLLLDAGTLIHSEFAQPVQKEKYLKWGNKEHVVSITGFERKAPEKDGDQQNQKNALFTIGRLIREGVIDAYSYSEVDVEVRQRRPQDFNAFSGCAIRSCSPALERSKFRKTIDLKDWFSKGGKKDLDAGVKLGGANQIAFFSWLNELNAAHIQLLLDHAAQIGLSEFEKGNLRKLDYFQFLCRRAQSHENYPDMFHLWTAIQNECDAFLTLEKKLPNIVRSIAREKNRSVEIKTEVLRPLDLLQKLNIMVPDEVPMESGRFYHYFELPKG